MEIHTGSMSEVDMSVLTTLEFLILMDNLGAQAHKFINMHFMYITCYPCQNMPNSTKLRHLQN